MRTLDQERFVKKTNRSEIAAIKRELKLQASIIGTFLATFSGLYFFNNVLTDGWLTRTVGLEAWSLTGLLGLVLTPFMNISFLHLIVSSILLVVLGWWVMLRDTRDFFVVHLMAMLGSGVMVWLFEASNMRWAGWGGVAFGMIGYLLTAGLFERRWGTILSSLVAVMTLGSFTFSALMPGAGGSWFGLAGGLLGGVLSAAYLGWRRKKVADPADLIGGLDAPASTAADVVLDFEAAEARVEQVSSR